MKPWESDTCLTVILGPQTCSFFSPKGACKEFRLPWPKLVSICFTILKQLPFWAFMSFNISGKKHSYIFERLLWDTHEMKSVQSFCQLWHSLWRCREINTTPVSLCRWPPSQQFPVEPERPSQLNLAQTRARGWADGGPQAAASCLAPFCSCTPALSDGWHQCK